MEEPQGHTERRDRTFEAIRATREVLHGSVLPWERPRCRGDWGGRGGEQHGSQLPGYVYKSPNVIWVVGTQKIVPNLDMALRRVWEYCLPLEDRSMKAAGQPGSNVGKLLIFEREVNPLRKVKMLLVEENLGN